MAQPPTLNDTFSRMTGGMRILFFMMACCFCLGPLLIVIGVIFLVAPNTRADDVKEYNAALTDYTSTTVPILLEMNSSVNTDAMTQLRQALRVEGNLKDVEEGTHVLFRRAGVPRSIGDTYTIATSGNGGATASVPFNIPFTSASSIELRCTSAQCTSSCGDNSYSCSENAMRGHCTSAYSGSYTHTDSGTCYDGDVCGRCQFLGQLSRACVVLDVTAQAVSTSSAYRSCEYPFSGSHTYTPTATVATIEWLASDDPYIALERITEGSRDFGITEEEQHNAGVALLAVGCCLAAGMGVGMFLLLKQQQGQFAEADAREHQVYQVQGQQQEMTPQPGYPPAQQQPQYAADAQPQPQYAAGGSYPPQEQQPQGYPPQQPAGYQQQPAGYQAQPSGHQAQPSGYPPQQQQQQQPGGYPQQQQPAQPAGPHYADTPAYPDPPAKSQPV